jgi:hypothetical protein
MTDYNAIKTKIESLQSTTTPLTFTLFSGFETR